jgi:hypothetical protein
MSVAGTPRRLGVNMTTSDLPRQADQCDARPDFAVGPTSEVDAGLLRWQAMEIEEPKVHYV